MGAGRRTAQEERKLRKKKIVDAVTAPIPKATATLGADSRLATTMGGNPFTTRTNGRIWRPPCLHLAIRDTNPTAMEVFRELVRNQEERDKLRDLYLVPLTSTKAVEKLAKKLTR